MNYFFYNGLLRTSVAKRHHRQPDMATKVSACGCSYWSGKSSCIAEESEAAAEDKQQSCFGLHFPAKREGFVPTAFEFDGRLTSNRSEWLLAAYCFGQSRFGDQANISVQQLRLAKLRSSHRAQMLDGERPTRVQFFDGLPSRYKSAGKDKNPP